MFKGRHSFCGRLQKLIGALAVGICLLSPSVMGQKSRNEAENEKPPAQTAATDSSKDLPSNQNPVPAGIPLRLKRFAKEQGLSTSGITCLVQDLRGFLWIGTGDGLNRFDGQRFTVFRNDPGNPFSLPYNDVLSLCVDRSGTLWVATQGGGLAAFDARTEHFTTYRNDPKNPHSLSHNEVRKVIEDRSGLIWAGTRGGGLCSFDPNTKSFTTYRHDPQNPHSLGHDDVRGLAVDQQNVLWVATKGGGLSRFNRERGDFTVFKNNPAQADSLPLDDARSVYVDRSNTLWVGTFGGGLCRFDRTRETFAIFKSNPQAADSISGNMVFGYAEDETGMFWIGTRVTGVCALDRTTGKFTRFRLSGPNADKPLGNTVESFCVDRSGIVWIGSSDGLYAYDRKLDRFQSFPTSLPMFQELTTFAVSTLAQSPDGTLWVGTSNGLCRFNRKTGEYKTYRTLIPDPKDPKATKRNVVLSLLFDRTGTLWVGTSRGLCSLDPATDRITIYPHEPLEPTGSSNNNILGLTEDRAGIVWITTRGGEFYSYDRKTNQFTTYREELLASPGLQKFPVRMLLEDRTGTLWIASKGGGLCRFDRATKQLTALTHDPNNPQSLASDSVNCLFEDQSGTLWVGMVGGGLDCYDRQTGTFIHYREKDGLINDSVQGILQDRNRNLWLSTTAGLSRFNPQTRVFQSFDQRDGIPCSDFSVNAALLNPAGEMIFGGEGGFTVFQPEQVRENPFVPPVVLTGFKKFNKPVDLPVSITEAPELEISYRDNFITFEFAALSFTNPEKNQFAYKLENFNQDWIQAGTHPSATFTNLDPGEYVLRVKAANNDGLWNETGAVLRLRVTPPWWKTKWAYGFYLFSVSGAIFGGMQWRVRSFKIRNRQLEAKVAERTVQLDQKNSELAANLEQLRVAKRETERKNKELDQKIQELVASQQQADRIFSALAEALPGTILEGKYRLGEKIGAGGFGAVFRATHLGLNRPIAVKIFRPTPGNDSVQAVERFKREGVSAARLNHPNVVTVLDSGVSPDGIAYLVMELLEGRSLAEELHARRRLTVRRTAQILHAASLALAEAHRIGIIHRDIKPENIFLHQTEQGEIIKVVDFGIAKLMEEAGAEAHKLTATSSIVGTPSYMAPERLRNQDYDGRSDVYSLGVVFYECVCGRTPFSESTNSFLDLVMAHLQTEPPPPRSFNPHLSPTIERVILTMLAKKPEERPTAAEMVAEFAQIVAEQTSAHELAGPDVETDISEIPTGFFMVDTMPIEKRTKTPAVREEAITVVPQARQTASVEEIPDKKD
ncbi:MAG: protein kinase [Blastocatellia bacterium]|nr:protein kinase [Blastocatellia bacterium]